MVGGEFVFCDEQPSTLGEYFWVGSNISSGTSGIILESTHIKDLGYWVKVVWTTGYVGWMPMFRADKYLISDIAYLTTGSQ